MQKSVTISLETAVLINNVFLPLNPNKLRTATPEVKAAVIEFKKLVAEKLKGWD